MIDFKFENAQFDYEPYPICYIPSFLDDELYKKLCDSYPDLDLLKTEMYHGKKLAMSEIVNSDNYYDFLKKHDHWKEFFDRIKSKEFVEEVFAFLNEKNIDLRINKFRYTANVKKKHNRFLALFSKKPTLKTRFEFSALPANGGEVIPHTDVSAKIVTFVISFMKPGEWKPEWGGGTSVVLPIDRTKVYNDVNLPMPHDEVEEIKTFPFEPNQAVLFIKTYNSWHSVYPATGPDDVWRKTVTMNVELVRT